MKQTILFLRNGNLFATREEANKVFCKLRGADEDFQQQTLI